MTSGLTGQGAYPTARLQRGWLLINAGQELVEEAVGFGVPVLKRGLQTIFPGEVELASAGSGAIREVTARFRLNLEEKMARPGAASVRSRWLYALKNLLAAVIRQSVLLRDPLSALSNMLRRTFGWETIFEASGFDASLAVVYRVDAQTGVIRVDVDTGDLPESGVTEIIMMNEQGARPFDWYRDSGEISLRGSAIGCWDEVTAEEASFVSEAHHLAFTLRQVNGARLYRGRELTGTRLAWAGFGYSFPPTAAKISYEIRIERLS